MPNVPQALLATLLLLVAPGALAENDAPPAGQPGAGRRAGAALHQLSRPGGSQQHQPLPQHRRHGAGTLPGADGSPPGRRRRPPAEAHDPGPQRPGYRRPGRPLRHPGGVARWVSQMAAPLKADPTPFALSLSLTAIALE